MLTTLSIKNYALIDTLNVEFKEGFTTITGETGAGKSILLGGLALVLGKRADLSSLKNEEEKCVIEAGFKVGHYNLKGFFEESDLDYEELTLIRREILPGGKSRAFVNDTPVRLDVLSSLGEKLIDIHSQHQTLKLTENEFQFQVIDAVAGNEKHLKEYRKVLKAWTNAVRNLDALTKQQSESIKELDYNQFLLQELEEAGLVPGMLEELESEYEQLNNIESIGEYLVHSSQLLGDERMGVIRNLAELKAVLQKLAAYGSGFKTIAERVHSTHIELDDIYGEIQRKEEELEADPGRLEELHAKLQKIYDLQKKHGVIEIEELIQIREDLGVKVRVTENLGEDIEKAQSLVAKLREEVMVVAEEISDRRSSVIGNLKANMENALKPLGMPDASFDIRLSKSDSFFTNGSDVLEFLFAANKGSAYNELKKVASGGELSRIMLVIKAILAKYMQLPTIMFDEIDTGVSGEVSTRMAAIMQEMSKTMQVFTITHLPQVAARGNTQFKVYKEVEGETTRSNIRELAQEERVIEIAEMLGGKDISDSARRHAVELLDQALGPVE
ncbi:DNA repair protein RecN [Robertkochia solimangrovi]|uniref:DNA repair protein RecN n=1 Tax=Robertkochia solimangrovi TaxID=2213046 RepID=UPI00117F16B0|nr:DNA repair protein RecN [Robertkochia solimangrovi]TRZ41077.1 DNA repair protein RecN [Robertkochia solimangrovi]